MTDDHLRHLSGPIVRAPYHTGPSPRRVDSPILLTLLLLHAFGEEVGFAAGVLTEDAGGHHMLRSYRSLREQSPRFPVPVRN